ncbi:hypothetical protein JANAI62_12990 [Jannaschia pagri]|uniref:Lipoprotein n=1 Tax=Jannaschia pagri TaxID=2829797 RepID=A0ABQ4NJV2_9RHOB|nr:MULTISPECIES: hypothetical protein [unclassified Jannaschia]GIT90844.1 hypothetical protein JANAI61_13020 [Jannaschia sp. AI_61]GIT94676.1 hypothetical protein JANAI62_12990 [Jannaschia sp. AI_62]
MLRALAVMLLVPLLVACGAEAIYDPLEEVERRAYAAPGPAKLTLITAINNRSGDGGHSALMVSGSQRVLFDPAGTWHHPTVPERGDVLYGITPTMLEFYTDYHARPTYHVVIQDLTVTPEQAERALSLVQAHGPASKATCGVSVSGILRELGYTQVRQSWFPDNVMRSFAAVPGVTERKIFDDTVDAHSPERPRVKAITDDGFVREAT